MALCVCLYACIITKGGVRVLSGWDQTSSFSGMASPGNGVGKLTFEDAVRSKFDNVSELNFLVIGCFHVGKSTLINEVFLKDCEKKAEEALEKGPCTSAVNPYTIDVDEIKLNIFDSPGLQDGVTYDRNYITELEKECGKCNLIIYCTKMGDPIRPCEKEALKNLTLAFKGAVWEKFVIALTFANQWSPSVITKMKKAISRKSLLQGKKLYVIALLNLDSRRSLMSS